jgi:alkylhydroperoxidase family enzyme
MAVVPYIELPDMPPSVRPLMQQVPPLNIFKALANSAAVITGLVELGQALRATGTLDKRLKELIILRVGFQSRAKYEVFQHRQVARVLDIAPEKVDARPAPTPATHESNQGAGRTGDGNGADECAVAPQTARAPPR